MSLEEFQTYQSQLMEVEAALKLDPDNETLKALLVEIGDAIEATATQLEKAEQAAAERAQLDEGLGEDSELSEEPGSDGDSDLSSDSSSMSSEPAEGRDFFRSHLVAVSTGFRGNHSPSCNSSECSCPYFDSISTACCPRRRRESGAA